MVLNLSKIKNDNKTVQVEDLLVEVKRLSRSEKIDVSTKAMGEDGEISSGEYSKAMFVASITDIDGLTDENGNKIGIEEHARELIWEYGEDKVVEAIKDAIQSFEVAEEKKSEELENESEPM